SSVHTAHAVHTARAVRTPSADALLPSVPLLRAAAELAAGIGAGQTFEFLLGRQLDANPRQYTLTPPGLAELMAAHGMHNSTDLIPRLAERGIQLSRPQVYRIVHQRPERVALQLMAALCDILGCGV
uniref:helix-turn-helix domain-containing protein n=1 Tax=Streptomyces sp. DSM 41540 TaxID=3448657 RepID=UPI00404018FC